MIMTMKRIMVIHFTIIFMTQMHNFIIQGDLKSISFLKIIMFMLIL